MKKWNPKEKSTRTSEEAEKLEKQVSTMLRKMGFVVVKTEGGIMTEKPKIPGNVLDAIKRVRESGKTNMFDVRNVQTLCKSIMAKEWITEHKDLYAKLIFEGPEAFEIV